MIHRIRHLFLPLLLAALFLIPSPAVANSAPPRMNGDKTGMVLPGASAQIHVVREELRFDVMRIGGADVTAAYELENRGEALVQYPVIFAIQTVRGGGAPTVTWNGAALAVANVEPKGLSAAQVAEMEKSWTAMEQVIDPATGELYSTKDWFQRPSLRLYQFHLGLAAGAHGRLEVRFAQQSATDRQRLLHPVYHYQYLLLPARAWASFGPLSITVAAPPPDEALFRSTLPMTWQDGAYHAEFPGLPDQNLAFALMSTEGMILGWESSGPYYLTAFLLLLLWAGLVGYGLGRLAGLIRSRGWAIAVAILSALLVGGAADVAGSVLTLALFAKALSSQGYGMAFAIAGEAFVATLVTAVVAPIVAGPANRRRAATPPPVPPVTPPQSPSVTPPQNPSAPPTQPPSA